MTALMPILERLFPLYRTLVSDGTDEALRIAGDYMPGTYWLEEYPCGQRVWDWVIPQRWKCTFADIGADEDTISIFGEQPLMVAAYSDNAFIDDLRQVHKADGAVPWKYHFYEPGSSVCVSSQDYGKLLRANEWYAEIRAEFHDSPGMHVGVGLIHPEGGPSGRGEIVVTSHVDHPYQANDGISGIVSAIALARMLAENPLPPGSLSVRFVFCPETIGMIAYLANNEQLIPNFRAGVVLEMTGSSGRLEWNRTKGAEGPLDWSKLDTIAAHVLGDHGHPFGTHPRNDEHILNSAGVEIPSIALHRWPFDEYHTSADTPAICSEDKLREAGAVAERIVRVLATDYVPRWTIRGPAMLSRHGLFVDWNDDWERNRLIERTMQHIDGQRSVWEIADRLSADYWKVRGIVEDFKDAGLVEVMQ